MPDDQRDFYVGYKPQAPAGLGRFVKRVVLALFMAAPVLAVVLVGLQSPFADSVFEYGIVREFEGRIATSPYPMLQVAGKEAGAPESHLLVEFGKRGATDAVAGLDGSAVKLDGQLIYRGESQMIELAAAPVADPGSRPQSLAGERSLGEHRLAGEIVDAKCHLGVMKPGHGKPHRACAARCISGGAPPMLWVRDRSGQERQFLLVGRDGRQLGAELLDVVAEPVEVTGEVVLRGDLWILRTEPGRIIRLEPDRWESKPAGSGQLESHGG